MEEAGEDDDDASLRRANVSRGISRKESGELYLDDEDENGVLGVVDGGVGTLEDSSLIGSSDSHGDGGLD